MWSWLNMIKGFYPKSLSQTKSISVYDCPPFTLGTPLQGLAYKLFEVQNFVLFTKKLPSNAMFTALYLVPHHPPPVGTEVGSVHCPTAGKYFWDERRLPQREVGGSCCPVGQWSCTLCTTHGASLGCLNPQSRRPCGFSTWNGCSQ